MTVFGYVDALRVIKGRFARTIDQNWHVGLPNDVSFRSTVLGGTPWAFGDPNVVSSGSKIVEVDNSTLFVEAIGATVDTLVCIHGFPWRRLVVQGDDHTLGGIHQEARNKRVDGDGRLVVLLMRQVDFTGGEH